MVKAPNQAVKAASKVLSWMGGITVKGSQKQKMVTATQVPFPTTNVTALECKFPNQETITKEISLKILGLDGDERFTRAEGSTGANGMKADITDWASSFIQMGELKTAGSKKINTEANDFKAN